MDTIMQRVSPRRDNDAHDAHGLTTTMTSAINVTARNTGSAFPRCLVADAMDKRPYFYVSLTAISILTVCLYFFAFYSDSGLRSTLLKTYTNIRDAIGGAEDYSPGQKLARTTEFKNENVKTILLWNTLFGDKNFYFGAGDIFHDCPVSKCKILNDRNYLNVDDFDAILFHGNELDPNDVPKSRSAEQLYVYVNLESPVNRPVPYAYFEDYFNLTMTYRLDSDIPWPYGIVEDSKNGRFVAPSKDADWNISRNGAEEAVDEVPSAILDVVLGKSKPITWFVSNCHAKSGRLEYVKELSKHIGVDIYGRCGAFRCSRSQDCFRDVAEPNYFFYLSFENTLCDDYVTEKLMNSLEYIIVPVVYGGANYSQFAPPNSYVNALDFESPKELAAYLRYLSEDLRRYQSFLQWKKYYRVRLGTKRTVCTLCEMLHKRTTAKRYSKLSEWYARDKCPVQALMNTANQPYATKTTLTYRT